MKKSWYKAILFIISVALGIILMMQFETARNVLNNQTVEGMTSELNSELAKLNVEKKELRDQIDSLKEQASKNEEEINAKEEKLKEIEKELEKQKILSGYYDVKGPGVIITVDADPNSYVSLASSNQYILALISYLNNAGAEAISINGQRYTNYTEIVPVLDHINVNGVAMVLPLKIKAIGNSRTIDASLNFVGGIVSMMKEIGFTIETEYLDEVVINRFEGEKKLKYAVPISPDESN